MFINPDPASCSNTCSSGSNAGKLSTGGAGVERVREDSVSGIGSGMDSEVSACSGASISSGKDSVSLAFHHTSPPRNTIRMMAARPNMPGWMLSRTNCVGMGDGPG